MASPFLGGGRIFLGGGRIGRVYLRPFADRACALVCSRGTSTTFGVVTMALGAGAGLSAAFILATRSSIFASRCAGVSLGRRARRAFRSAGVSLTFGAANSPVSVRRSGTAFMGKSVLKNCTLPGRPSTVKMTRRGFLRGAVLRVSVMSMFGGSLIRGRAGVPGDNVSHARPREGSKVFRSWQYWLMAAQVNASPGPSVPARRGAPAKVEPWSTYDRLRPSRKAEWSERYRP